MNCSRFRFLIQQKFDLDLAPQEERIVLAHLESCESCEKFYNQLQQVILAAEEVSLPNEILPANEEQLARMIMSQLPATKPSPFAFFTNLFQKKEAPPSMQDTRVRRGPAGKQAASGSSFPHRSGSAIKDASPAPNDKTNRYKGAKGEEFSGASNRLRAMNKGLNPEAEQRELQSRTLGEKLGKSVPVQSGVDNAPLTLAESIRKKISEGTKPADNGNLESYDDEDSGENENDNYDTGFDNSNEQSINQAPAPQAMPGFNQGMMQPMAPGLNPAAMQPPYGSDNRQPSPMIAPGTQQAGSSPNAPVVGSWGKPSSADSGDWKQGGAPRDGSVPGSFPQNAPMQQVLPPQPYLAQQPAQPAQPAQNPGWGTTWDNNAGNSATTPSTAQNAPAQQPSGNWGSPEPVVNNWGQAPAAQPSSVLGMQQQVASPAWGAPPMPAPNVNPQVPGYEPSPASPAPAWSQPAVPKASSAPAPAAPTPPQAAGWGASGVSDSWDAAGSQRGWGQSGAEVSKPSVPTPIQQAPQPAPAVDAWGQPVAQSAWGQTVGAVNNNPASVQAQPAPQQAGDSQQAGWGGAKPQGAWGTPTDANDWSAPQNAAQAAVVPPPAPQPPAPRLPARPAWSLESEQIETGTWQAFSPSGETLGAKASPAPAKKVETDPISAASVPIEERWSTPIQSRAKSQPELEQPPAPANPQPMPQQAFAPPVMPPVTPAPNLLVDENDPAVAHGKSGFDFPIYSPDSLQEAEPNWGAPPAPVNPQPVVQQPVVQQPSLQQSVMQKLNSTLDESAGGNSGAQQNSWELSIQEKLQAQQRALQGASMQQLAALPAPAPVQQPAAASQEPAWNAQSQSNNWGAAQNITQPAQSSGWGADPTPQVQNPAPMQTQQSFQTAPPVQPPEQKSSLFSLDDQAIDKLFNENLKFKSGATPAGSSAPKPQAAPPAPPAPAVQQPAPAWAPAPTTWAPAPTTWAPEPQPMPAPVQAAPEAPQFAQNQQGQANAGWGDPSNQQGAPVISPIAPRPNAPNVPNAPYGEDRRVQRPAGGTAQYPLPQQTPEPIAQAPMQAQSQQGLFNLDDRAMDQLFQKNLGVEEALQAGSGNAPTPPAIPSAPITPAPSNPAPIQNSFSSGGWANPPEAPQAPVSSWASPTQNTQAGGFQPTTQQAPQPAAPQMQQPQPTQSQPTPGGWGAPQQPVRTPSIPTPEQYTPLPQQPVPRPMQPAQPPAPPAPPAQQPAQGGWGQAASTGSGWGQQQQPSTPQPRIGAPAEPGKPRTGLFSIDDSLIDSIFADNLGVRDAKIPKVNVNEAVSKLSEAAAMQQNMQNQQMPASGPSGYGESSYDNPAPVKIEGVGRLDSRVDNNADQSSGRIASIGKFLLDQKDLEKIGNITEADLSDSSMRILTTEAASELQQLLQHIGQQKSVIGSVIIGHDGLLIANTLPPDFDAESMGQFALGIYMNTSNAVTKFGHEHIHQFVGRTPRGYIVIADFGGGLLVTISEGSETEALIPLMRSITQLVAQ